MPSEYHQTRVIHVILIAKLLYSYTASYSWPEITYPDIWFQLVQTLSFTAHDWFGVYNTAFPNKFHIPDMVGRPNADIPRYNADILSISLHLWAKLVENVSWVNTSQPLSPISFSFIRENRACRVIGVSTMQATAPRLSVHMMLSRGNDCHKRAATLIPWGQREFVGNFWFEPG